MTSPICQAGVLFFISKKTSGSLNPNCDGGLTKLAERHQLLSPGCQASMLGKRRATVGPADVFWVSVVHLDTLSGLTGDTVHMTGPASWMIEAKGAESVGQSLTHATTRFVDKDRTDPDPLIGDHTTGAALQVVQILVNEVALSELPSRG